MLWENISISKYEYHTKYRLPSGYGHHCKRRTYLCLKLWNSDVAKAEALYKLLGAVSKYDRVKLHKGCVYASRRLETN
jgi:hypothetical protein